MLNNTSLTEFAEAIHDKTPVNSLTHTFYRYPARFSPKFVNAAIRIFTNNGDLVFDPFVGGGTTLVEASILGRKAIGTDINSLSIFLSKVKTTILSDDEISEIEKWATSSPDNLNLHNQVIRADQWIRAGYQKNLNGKQTWPLRKFLELALNNLDVLNTEKQKNFVRCVLLRTAQWAVDNRKEIPSARQIRHQFTVFLNEMLINLREYAQALHKNIDTINDLTSLIPICIQRSAIDLENDDYISNFPPPKLIITSPPYPGVHILYHRWQVHGRKETPAPFWVANCADGQGGSYYTFGDRNTHDSGQYYEQLSKAFSSISKLCDQNTLIIQLVGFSNPINQIDKYISTLSDLGLREVKIPYLANYFDGRIWREIPNRKWYVDYLGKNTNRYEVVLIHQLS
jgi:hypothetical protein